MRAGVRMMLFPGDSRPVAVPSDRVAEAQKAGATFPKPSLGSTIAALGNPQSYSSPERAGELAAQGGQAMYDLAAQNMPAILGTAATLPLGGIGGRFAGPIARTAAGAAGMGAGSVAGDVMQGQTPDMGRAAANARFGLVAGPVGELAAGAGMAGAKRLTRSWVRPTPSMLEESPMLVEDVLTSRARFRKGGKEAKEPLRAKTKSMASTENMVNGINATISADAALGGVLGLRDKIARSAPTDARLPEIDAFINDFRAKWGQGRIPLNEAHPMKQVAQSEASWTENSNLPPTTKMLNRLVSIETRKAIGRQLPNPQLGGDYNAQDAMTHRMHEAAKATERAATVSHGAGMAAHVVPTVIAGAGGSSLGPMAGAESAAAAYAIMRLLDNPYVANRLALALSSRGMQAGLRSAPRFAAPIDATTTRRR